MGPERPWPDWPVAGGARSAVGGPRARGRDRQARTFSPDHHNAPPWPRRIKSHHNHIVIIDRPSTSAHGNEKRVLPRIARQTLQMVPLNLIPRRPNPTHHRPPCTRTIRSRSGHPRHGAQFGSWLIDGGERLSRLASFRVYRGSIPIDRSVGTGVSSCYGGPGLAWCCAAIGGQKMLL